MVSQTFRDYLNLYKAAKSAGLNAVAAQDWADNAVKAAPRRRNAYDYNGEYEIPAARHWTAYDYNSAR